MTGDTELGWYDQIYADDAMFGPDFCDNLYYPHERRRRLPVATRAPITEGAPGMMLVEFIDALLEKRPMSVLEHKRQQHQSIATTES